MSNSAASKKDPRPVAVSTPIPIPENRAAAPLKAALEFQQTGKLQEALKAYDDVLKVSPRKLAALVNKGVVLRKLGQHEKAMSCFWQGLSVDPDSPEVWHNISNTLLDMQRYDEANETLKRCVEKLPLLSETWMSLSRLLLARRQFAAAEFALQNTLELNGENHAMRFQLATLLLERGKLTESLAAYQGLEKVAPEDSTVQSGIGQALIGLRRMEEALPYLEKAVALDANNLDAKLGLARWHLLEADFKRGWDLYEHRRTRTEEKQPKVTGPEWNGEDIEGKTILIYAEQGFGDTIQFFRYLPLLAKRGAKIIVVCQKSLASLAARVEGVSEALYTWRPLPAYDCHAPLMSLPHKMGLGAEGIQMDKPYVSTSKNAQMPMAPLGTKLRVGLVWAGSSTHPDDHNRSVGLEGLLPLAGIPGVKIYSLQVGPRADDLKKLAHPALVQDFSKHLKEFSDTASVINQLDLVISVDSAVAHLAGSLGKPVWVMVPSVPDWRWQNDRTDSPWYPTMRLFRQKESGDWASIVSGMVDELEKLASGYQVRNPEPDFIEANSIFTKEGQPRFKMKAPRQLLNDPGISFLMRRERAGVGYEYATRSLIDAHIQKGDLFIDIGAHWGIMSMQAATAVQAIRKTDQVRVLAFEPAPHNLMHLKDWISTNDLTDKIEIIGAAVSDQAGKGGLRPESTMGHSLVKIEDGLIPVVTIDETLAARPELKDRRVIIKIDVEGHEPEVIAGMKDLIKSGRIAMVIWERGVEYSKEGGKDRLKLISDTFADAGFTSWRFENEDMAGPLVPYIEDGRTGNVIELAKNILPLGSYGMPRPVPVEQPEDPLFDIAERARAFFEEGTRIYTIGKHEEALAMYAESASLDSRIKELYNNLGVMMKDHSLTPARIACYQRGHRISTSDAGLASNLANALREIGDFKEARRLHNHALSISPDNADFIYNAGLVDRDDGKPETALPMIDKSLALKSENPDCKWDRALLLMQMGNYAEGFPAYESRWGIARAIKRNYPMPKWDGSSLNDKTIFVHDEQGFGDILQFARFLPELKKRGASKVILECQPELMRLMVGTEGVDAVIPRAQYIPSCDVYSPLLSLPGLFGTTLETLPNSIPYLHPPEMDEETRAALPKQGMKIGLVWAGQLIPRDRSCPLEKILPCVNDPRYSLISLQVGERVADIGNLGVDTFLSNVGPYLKDFAETAAVLKNLDALVTIDTSVAHLAGALGVPTFLLLRYTSDWRWFDQIEHSPWYPSIKIFRQTELCRWEDPLEKLSTALKNYYSTLASP